MSPNKRFVIAYIFLVGLPLVGLVGVLKTGRGLQAPLSINGVWKLESDDPTLLAQLCMRSVAPLRDTDAVIAQSGNSFAIHLEYLRSGTVGWGTIQNTTLWAAIPETGDFACGPDRAITLRGTVNPNTMPRSMRLVISIASCASCVPVEFHAVLQASPGGKELR